MKQTDIESIIQRYTDAEIAVLDGKSITFNGQQMTLENLSENPQRASGMGASSCFPAGSA